MKINDIPVHLFKMHFEYNQKNDQLYFCYHFNDQQKSNFA